MSMIKTALITGASGGLGYEFAKIFAARKCDLVLVARSKEKLDEIKAELEEKYAVNVLVIAKDLTESSAANEIYERLGILGVRIDYLINNAGFGDNNCYFDTEWQRQEQIVKLNILSLMHLTHLFGNDMRRRGEGKILNVASIAAFMAGPYMSVYYASKAFVLSFSQAIGAELRPYGVTVTALCPGPTTTGFEAAANLENSRMFKLFKPAEASAVARTGYAAMMKGKTVAFQDFVTHSTTVLSRIFPRCMSTAVAKYVNSPAKAK